MNILKAVVSILVCQAAGLVGSLFTAPAIPVWYENLAKPAFTPPDRIFAPVWTILYLLMGVALFLVWRGGLERKWARRGMVLFGIQLVLNMGWSAAFFGGRSPLAGLVVIVLLWIAILLTMLDFFRISRAAGVLLTPYIAWVSYAALLNASIYTLNR